MLESVGKYGLLDRYTEEIYYLLLNTIRNDNVMGGRQGNG